MPIRDPFPNPADISRCATGRYEASGQYRDLCSNCDNAESCGGGTRPRRPIFFCEEFVVFGTVATATSEQDRSFRKETRETRRTSGHIGLCMNCDNAGTCTLPKPEGGIWHCEEYR